MNNPITWFEIPATDLDRATHFWQSVLGTTLKRERFAGEDLAIFPRAQEGGVAGALKRDERGAPATHGTTVYLNAAPSLDACLVRVEREGGRVVMPKTDIGPPGFIAIVRDTEGNTVGLHIER